MENETTNQIPRPPVENMMPPTAPEKTSTSGIIGTVIIIALIILGGLYFWGKRINTQKEASALMRQEQTADQQSAAIDNVSDKDDTASLEAELNATQTTGLGTELQ